MPRLRDDPGRIVLAVDVPRELHACLVKIATAEQRTTRAQHRVALERYVAEHAEQHSQAA